MTGSTLILALGALILLAPGGKAQAAKFTICKGTYALCTSAACTPIPGNDDTVSCACNVRNGYSAGRDACRPAKDTGEGKQVQSRYYPVKSLAVCANDRPWANCLDKPCVVDTADPAKAECACTVDKEQGLYVIVGDTYTPSTCTTGILSSATFVDHERITNFLKTTTELKPFAVKVLNPSQAERRLEPTGGQEPE